MSRRIVIAGGGLVGLGLGLALKQALGASHEIVVADPAFVAPDRPDDRAFAIAAAGRRMFGALGVWAAMEPGSQPITDMVITDSRTRDVVRPAYLTFGEPAGEANHGGPAEAGEPFAHMVWSKVINRTLGEACRASGVELRATAVEAATVEPGRVRLDLGDGESLGAALLVAADGARSRLREGAGIGWTGWAYGQSGIVATIGHERDHGGRAVEHFLPAGPFAILPLPRSDDGGFRSSIVWTERGADASALLALAPEDLTQEIESRFGLALGAIRLASPARAYPLNFGIARRFIAPRLALVGDAAHVIHPIAGQGLNLGLKDVAALAQAIVDAARLGLDIGGDEALRPYEAARRFDAVAMGAATDGLNRLFSNDLGPVRLARDLGLGLVDRMPRLKRRLIAEAAGLKGGEPRLLKGEAL